MIQDYCLAKYIPKIFLRSFENVGPGFCVIK